MYRPKESGRWLPRVILPIRLDDQCLNVVYNMFNRTAVKLASGRNIRQKKAIREYISINVPTCLQKRVMDRALNKLVGAQTTLNLLDMFEPGQMAKDSVDLLGNFRLGFGCYFKEGRLTWSQGSAKKFNLTVPQLDQLHSIMLWSQPSQLKELTISISRGAIKMSRLPNILAQARSLTRVTIMSGAENHTLRILGLNCPCLSYLDVSHSNRVTDQGLRSLLVKQRSRKRQPVPGATVEVMAQPNDEVDLLSQETNPCAKTISSIILVGTSVTWKGCNLVCKLMDFGYLTASLPFIRIVRMDNKGLCYKGLPMDRQMTSLTTNSLLNEGLKDVIFTTALKTLLPEHLKSTVLDYYPMNCQKPSQCISSHSQVFLRDSVESFKIHLHMKMESVYVTSLILPWYTFTWRLDSLLDLDTLGMNFPKLRFLKGRIKGRWNRAGEPLLPHLEAAYVWSLNSSTALSMIQSIPFLKFLEFNNTHTLVVRNSNWELKDTTLEAALNQNKSLANSLESFTVRPSDLTATALKILTKKCPNLKRIGDLESWSLDSDEISEFNVYLDSVRSQCILTIMNFPPANDDKYQWTF